ncbi:MAG: proline--tRNA ligase, partial [Candidatus Shapirobacteria bacterium]|nr:proline--tRNA ligase [Candidatus Shapirobacteria bacterium]
MLYSKLFGKTIREEPKEAFLLSHKLLYKAGFIRELTAGRYLFTHLGWRVLDKIVKIIDEEMTEIGSQRVATPTLHPLELWQKTHRDEAFGESLMRVKDRRGADFAIGATHEAVMVEFVKKFKLSFKDLPIVIHQFSLKFRDELRARGGLIRLREFLMKDAYSFAADEKQFMET